MGILVVGPASPAGATIAVDQTWNPASCNAWSNVQAPAGATAATFSLWGGGGGGGDRVNNTGGNGGAGGNGGVVSGTISVTAGQYVWAKLGCGGADGSGSGVRAGGYIQGGSSRSNKAGGGGGASGLALNSSSTNPPTTGSIVAVAGGGGGGANGVQVTSYCNGGSGGNGGGGGSFSANSGGGQAGTSGANGATCNGTLSVTGGGAGTATGGGGGTGYGSNPTGWGNGGWTAPGTLPVGNGPYGPGESGDPGYSWGGLAQNTNNGDGGGGGGGFATGGGGGAGTNQNGTGGNNASGAGGGGGSSWRSSAVTNSSFGVASGSYAASNNNSCSATPNSGRAGQGSVSGLASNQSNGTAGCPGWVTVTWTVTATTASFTASPAGTAATGEAFLTQPVVNVAAGGGAYAGFPVVLSIAPSTGTAGASLSCTSGLTVSTNGSGNASFAGCEIDKAGVGYQLRATTESGTVVATSAAFNVRNGATASLASSCGGSTYQTVAVPAGVISASVSVTGAGGGSGGTEDGALGAGNPDSGAGGGGAKVDTTLVRGTDISGGNTLAVTLGCGGGAGDDGSTKGSGGTSMYGAGGNGGGGAPTGGGGGGASAVCIGTTSACTTPLVVAAGGGGGSGAYSCSGTTTGAAGGNGAKDNGANGNDGVGGDGGKGATSSAVGAGGSGSSNGGPGVTTAGGTGASTDGSYTGGGGGGAGYYGGGAGASHNSGASCNEWGGGGGAGSSFAAGTGASFSGVTSRTTSCGQANGVNTTSCNTGEGGAVQTSDSTEGYQGSRGAASISWTVGASQIAVTTPPGSPQTYGNAFGFVAQLRDYLGNTVTGDSITGTPTVTLNPGVGCPALVSAGSASYDAATGVITVTGVQASACAASSTLSITAVDATTGLTLVGTTSGFIVNKANQSVSFTSSNPSPVTLPSGTYTVSATATSGLPVSYSLDVASSGCSIAGNVVTFTEQGSCLVNASQGGNGNYNAAATVTQVISVNRGSQAITGVTASPASPVFGGGTFTMSASGGGSGNPVTFSSGSPGVCTTGGTNGATVTIVAAGTCTILANQAGNTLYDAAPQVSTNVGIGKANQTIGFTSSAPSPGFVGGPAYTVSASASSGLAVAFTLDGSSTGCSLSGSSVTFTGAGTCRVNANQAGDSNWNAAAQVQQSFAVVVPRATSTVLSCVNPTLAYDSTASCTVTVSDLSGSPVTPSSAVALSATGSPGTATFSSCALAQVSVGVASCVVTFTVTEQDSYLVSASAVVNAVHGASSSNVVSVKFGPHATSTVVSCSPSSLVAGSPSSCTATVTDTQVGVTKTSPTGTVVFGQSGGGSFSSTTCALSAGVSPVSSCSVSFTPTFGGAKTVTASFDGFSSGAVAGGFRHRSSSAVPVPLTVSGSSAQHPTTTSVSCSPNPVQVSTATTCTAIVTDTMTFAATATPTGTVNFAYSGGGALSPTSCTLTTNVVNVSAKCSVTFTPNGIAGSKTVQANYAGVPVLFKASGSGSVFVTATAAPVTPPTPQVQHPTSTSVSCSPSTLPLGNASTCTVTVTDTYDGVTSSPAGTVSVGSSGGGTLSAPTCTLQPSGNEVTSTCQVTFTPTGAKGSKTVIASYAGTPQAHKASGSGSFYLNAT